MQSAEMVFIIIFAIIVMGFVLVYGANVITDMFCIGNVASTDKAIKNLETMVQEVYHFSEGSSQLIKLNLPSNVKVCFIDSENPGANRAKGWDPDPAFEDLIKLKKYNVWIYYNCGSSKGNGFQINYLSTSENFCTAGSRNLYLENKGTSVSIGE